MDFYEKLLLEKNKRSLNNKDVGAIIDMTGEAFRMAVKRKSLNPLQVKEIEKYFEIEQDTQSMAPIVSSAKGVPYYDVDFVGGFDLVFNNQAVVPQFYINFAPFNDADCWVNVTGKSMSPFISHGDLIAIKRLNNWKEFLLMGEIYAIITDEFRTVKIISKGSSSDYLKLIPYSKDGVFVEQDIPKKLIKDVFAVKGSIKKFF
jgi:SOS-response transcriptional repressor LexA